MNTNETTENSVENTTNTTNDTVAPVTTNTAPVATTNSSSNYNVTNNTQTLPQTGENDIYVVGALLIICGVSAIYAYRKIREYNV